MWITNILTELADFESPPPIVAVEAEVLDRFADSQSSISLCVFPAFFASSTDNTHVVHANKQHQELVK